MDRQVGKEVIRRVHKSFCSIGLEMWWCGKVRSGVMYFHIESERALNLVI